MPKVLCILNRLIIGGPAVVATYLAHYMSPEFETVMVVGGKDDHEQDANHLTEEFGIKPIVIPEMKRSLNFKNDRAAYRKIKSLIKELKPDIVHTHAAKSGALGRLAASACGVPVIVHTFHGHVFHSYFSPLKNKVFINAERWLAKKSSAIIAISEQQKNELVDSYRICPREKMNVVELGLDLDKFQIDQDNKRMEFRRRYNIAHDEIAIGIVGRIVPVKNHSLFVSVAAEVLKHTGKKLRFIVVGDGDMRENMEIEFRQAGIDYTYCPDERNSSTAICTSWQTAMDAVYAGLDIVVLTSNNEGTPVTLIEAQAAAKPIVATRVGGVEDIMLDGETGYSVPPKEIGAFSKALLKLIEDERGRLAFGRRGREFVHNRFSYQRMVKTMSTLYNQLLAAK
jgi:glycosyltransferase involved in cell wall biosynthesis